MRSGFAFKVEGYTIGMTSFSRQYADWIKKQKQSVQTAMSRWVGVWASEVVTRARHNAPEFDEPGYTNSPTSLTNSIVKTETTTYTNHIKIMVGVSSSWSSSYDEWFVTKYNSKPPWGVSSPQLALWIHENWDSFATERARNSAAKKGARYGSVVGERFLYRAARDASDDRGLVVMARQIFKTTVGRYGAIAGNKFGNTVESERSQI